jgi:hypothetical protein
VEAEGDPDIGVRLHGLGQLRCGELPSGLEDRLVVFAAPTTAEDVDLDINDVSASPVEVESHGSAGLADAALTRMGVVAGLVKARDRSPVEIAVDVPVGGQDRRSGDDGRRSDGGGQGKGRKDAAHDRLPIDEK